MSLEPRRALSRAKAHVRRELDSTTAFNEKKAIESKTKIKTVAAAWDRVA
jgi:hypothetical protein